GPRRRGGQRRDAGDVGGTPAGRGAPALSDRSGRSSGLSHRGAGNALAEEPQESRGDLGMRRRSLRRPRGGPGGDPVGRYKSGVGGVNDRRNGHAPRDLAAAIELAVAGLEDVERRDNGSTIEFARRGKV